MRRALVFVGPPPLSYALIDLSAHFPFVGVFNPAGYPFGVGFTFGPWTGKRYVYSHADDPAFADDDLELNGTRIFADNIAGSINGGATTLLIILPAGATLNVNVWDAGGSAGAFGSLRLYTRRLNPSDTPVIP